MTAPYAEIGAMSHPATGAKGIWSSFMGALFGLVGVGAASVTGAGRPPFAASSAPAMVSGRRSMGAAGPLVGALARTTGFPFWPQQCGAVGLLGCLLLQSLRFHSGRGAAGRGEVFYTFVQYPRGMRRVG